MNLEDFFRYVNIFYVKENLKDKILKEIPFFDDKIYLERNNIIEFFRYFLKVMCNIDKENWNDGHREIIFFLESIYIDFEREDERIIKYINNYLQNLENNYSSKSVKKEFKRYKRNYKKLSRKFLRQIRYNIKKLEK